MLRETEDKIMFSMLALLAVETFIIFGYFLYAIHVN